MRIYLGSDHAGYELKEAVKRYLQTKENIELEDFGAYYFDPKDDYPDFIKPVAEAVSHNPDNARGVVFGKSGQGEAIVSNRYKNIRAVVFYGDCAVIENNNASCEIIRLSRAHSNSNILSFGAGFVSFEDAKKALDMWLQTDFEGGRHQRRIDKID